MLRRTCFLCLKHSTILKMNWHNIFLTMFLMSFSFCQKVAVTGYKTFYGVLGGSVSLPISKPPNIKLHDMKWLKGKKLLQQIKLEGTNSTYSDRYHLFLNGTLKISGLQMEDDGVYIAEAYDAAGKAIPIEPVAVRVTEDLPRPQISLNCFSKTLICEVKYNMKQKPNFTLTQSNSDENYHVPAPQFVNGSWSVTYQLEKNYGNFICVVNNEQTKQQAEVEVKCSGSKIDIFLILIIGGGAVILIILVALLIFCIRKKRPERGEMQAVEGAMTVRTVTEDMKYRKLPQPPVQAAPSQPAQQQRPPSPHSELRQQAKPPLPRPRPQRKPLHRAKERP